MTVYLREGRIFIQHSDRTVMRTAGFWVGAPPVISLSHTDDPAIIGQAVFDALARSRVEVPVPERGAKPDAPLRAAAGVTSHRAFVTGTRACWVGREKHAVRIEPLHNGGASGEERGFRPLAEDQTLHLDADATPETMGRAVLTALARATL